MANEETTSVLVSRTLNDLGYSQMMVKLRQQFWADMGLTFSDGYVMVVGSKAEGLTRFSENDIDIMDATYDILSTSYPLSHSHTEGLTVFKIDRANIAPGYTRLVFVKAGTKCHSKQMLASLTESIAGNIYLSSDSWRQFACQFTSPCSCLQQQGTHGPSNTYNYVPSASSVDLVSAIICNCSDILQYWINRPRRYEWPSDAVIQDVSSLEAHVVPVGFKGSACQALEWRICFTKAEIKLTQSLNDCLIKLIILLKMIVRSSLKPLSKNITTYMIKNIVFWMAELFPAKYFTQFNLFPAIKSALTFLRECLVARYLPSYMIPERNLFADKLDRRARSWLNARSRLCAMIDILLAEGTHMFLRCEKIRNIWNGQLTASIDLCLFSKRSIQIEISVLCYMKRLKDGDLGADEIEMLEFWINDIIHHGPSDKFLTCCKRLVPFMK